ncbi:blue copper protein 1b-like [Impatiens glandulifera]|uniref:blue copper protein 1b-like n=1 Tax=Impatiens glandulifera TaxID=253017 RepID=UPI001FB16A71|nr:blue copper protein 1b-like [Impatiens glandulifera]
MILILSINPSLPASAIDYIVGDENGWTTNLDYQTWAVGKHFQIGDNIIFRYPYGIHNVYRVTAPGYHSCEIPANTSESMSSGNDVIALNTEGRRWYICGIGDYCKMGNMKLAITVFEPVVPPMALIVPNFSNGGGDQVPGSKTSSVWYVSPAPAGFYVFLITAMVGIMIVV